MEYTTLGLLRPLVVIIRRNQPTSLGSTGHESRAGDEHEVYDREDQRDEEEVAHRFPERVPVADALAHALNALLVVGLSLRRRRPALCFGYGCGMSCERKGKMRGPSKRYFRRRDVPVLL